MIWVRLLPYIAVVVLVAGGIWKWNSMVDTVELQKTQLEAKEKAINALKDSIVAIEEKAARDKEQAVKQAIVVERKKVIQSGMAKDESNKVDIDSKRFYITP